GSPDGEPLEPPDGLRAAALGELISVLRDHPSERLQYLPNLAAYVAYPLQARIIGEELPVLAASVRRDRGARPGRPRGERFLDDQETLLNNLTSGVDPQQQWSRYGAEALTAFDHAGIGRESLVDESGSDAMIRTVTTTAGVVATVV